MRTQKYNSEEEWKEDRRGRITGTQSDLLDRSGNYKIGFYQILAERIGIPASDENPMDRGVRLEKVAIERFEKETGKKVNSDLIIWFSDEDENLSLSPDGQIGKTQAVEVKCLSSAKHLQAYIKQEIPKEYVSQALQYFVINEKLRKLYFVFYDSRMPIDFFYLEIDRTTFTKGVAEKRKEELRKALDDLEMWENELTFK